MIQLVFLIMAWFFHSKKEIKEHLDKIHNRIDETIKDNISKDEKIKRLEEEIRILRSGFLSRNDIELMIRQVIEQSKNKRIAYNEPNQFRQNVIRNALNSRPEMLMQLMRNFLDQNMRTKEIYFNIVIQKKLISKTMFYHYLGIVKAEREQKEKSEPKNKDVRIQDKERTDKKEENTNNDSEDSEEETEQQTELN